MTGAADPSVALFGMESLAPLLVVLALLLGLVWLLRRGTIPLGRFNRVDVKIEGSVGLGERRSLVVVCVEGRRLLLGLTPAAVSLVTELGTTGGRFEDALTRQTSRDRQSEGTS